MKTIIKTLMAVGALAAAASCGGKKNAPAAQAAPEAAEVARAVEITVASFRDVPQESA